MTTHRKIINAIPADVTKITELVNSAYRGEDSKQGWTTEADLLDGTRVDEMIIYILLTTKNTTILKYVDGPEILGCVELRVEPNGLYLGMLSVRPNLQGEGIGKKLLQAAEIHAREFGCDKIFMTVISVRQQLIDWYIRHGYQLTGERKPFAVPDKRFGIPKQELEFVVLEKTLATQ
jgi:ribosomal protein S18 acetylase RimI-like enzyme